MSKHLPITTLINLAEEELEAATKSSASSSKNATRWRRS